MVIHGYFHPREPIGILSILEASQIANLFSIFKLAFKESHKPNDVIIAVFHCPFEYVDYHSTFCFATILYRICLCLLKMRTDVLSLLSPRIMRSGILYTPRLTFKGYSSIPMMLKYDNTTMVCFQIHFILLYSFPRTRLDFTW